MSEMRPWGVRGAVVAMLATAMTFGASMSARAIEVPNKELTGKKLTFTFVGTDPEHVLGIDWKNSAGVDSNNLVAEGGPVSCGDPSEFFGQSYGAPEGGTPNVVFSNHVSKFHKDGKLGANIVGSPTDCASAAALPVTTHYQLFKGAPNEVQITRTLGFGKHSGLFSGVGVRPYVPRLHDDAFSSVIMPNGASNGVNVVSVFGCPGDCIFNTGDIWNGQWLADSDPTSGDAMIVLRDPAMPGPIAMTINYDGFSASNLSSFVIPQPTKGWKKPVTETEYLCFEDLTSWPQAERDAAVLPSGCGPVN